MLPLGALNGINGRPGARVRRGLPDVPAECQSAFSLITFRLVLIPLLPFFLLAAFLGQPAFSAADRFFALNPAQFALGNKPAFPADGAQHTAAGDFLSKALHQLFLRFVISQFNFNRQLFSHPFFAALIQKGRSFFAHPFRQ